MAICSTSRPCAKKKEVETREGDYGFGHHASILGTLKQSPLSRRFPWRSGQLLRGEKVEVDGWTCSELGLVLPAALYGSCATCTWEEDALMSPAMAGGAQQTPSKSTTSYFKAQVDITEAFL